MPQSTSPTASSTASSSAAQSASQTSTQPAADDLAHQPISAAFTASNAIPGAARVQAMRWLAVASLVALIVLGLGWELHWAPVKPGGSLLALKVLPLCFAMAGLLKQRMYTYRWLSLMIWLYVAEGAVRGYGDRPPGNWLGWLEVALCLVLFTACTLHIRFRQAGARAMQAATAAPNDASTDAPTGAPTEAPTPSGNTPSMSSASSVPSV